MVVLGQSGGIRAKVVVLGQKWLHSGKRVVFEQISCIRAIVAVLEKSVCLRENFGFTLVKWWYSGKSGCVGAKMVVFGQSG